MTRAALSALALAVALVATRAHAQGRTRAPGGTRADGIAVVIGGTAPGPTTEAILRSDVELRARLRLAGETGVVTMAPLPEALLRASLDELVTEALIAREAERVRVVNPDDAQIAAERARLEAIGGGASLVRDLLRVVGASADELEAWARRRALVSAFLTANLQGATQISDAQVDRAYESGEHPFVDRPLDDVREELRAWLSHQALDRAVRRWVQVLRGRTPVRMFVDWSGAS